MAVENLDPGDVMHLVAGEIQGTAHVFRTNRGDNTPGNVGWLPNGGVLQQCPLAVGETVSFAINGQPGVIANGCPSVVQVLWTSPKVTPGQAQEILQALTAPTTTSQPSAGSPTDQ